MVYYIFTFKTKYQLFNYFFCEKIETSSSGWFCEIKLVHVSSPMAKLIGMHLDCSRPNKMNARNHPAAYVKMPMSHTSSCKITGDKHFELNQF